MADEYHYDAVVIHGPLDLAQRKYPEAVGGLYTSHNGKPAFCMSLTITDFIRTPGGDASCTISEAKLLALNPGGQTSYFGYGFDIYASISIGDYNHPVSRRWLFDKPASDAQWGDNEYGMPQGVKVTLTAPYRSGQEFYIVISILSICDCGQAGVITPVYVDKLTQYIPQEPDPYLWRLQHGKDPTNPDLSEPLKWHLVRPFYVCKTINGKKGWCSCEDMTKLVYDEEGHKISED